MDNFLIQLKNLFRKVERLEDKIPVGTQIYPQIATIQSVNDPKNKGRVKVSYDNAPEEISEWIEIANYHSGNIPEQYVGTRMVAVFLGGRAEDAVLLGTLLTDLDLPITSQPISIPVIDEQLSKTLPECSSKNEGNLIIFSNTISSDLKICIRRNSTTRNKENPQKIESVYSWKSITNSLQIARGEYGDPQPDLRVKKGIPSCTYELEGEKYLYSEDRALRQIELVCRKMPGGVYAWINSNSPSVYVRSLLPPCKEESHGLQVVLDDGYNSEVATCLRRKKEMKWTYSSNVDLEFFPDPIPQPAELTAVTQNLEAELPKGFSVLPETLTFKSSSLGSITSLAIREVSKLLKL